MSQVKVEKINNILGLILPEPEFREGQQVTISKCSIREFNIRWWGFGFSMVALGLFLGIMMGMNL